MPIYPLEKKPWVSWFDDPHQRIYISWETEESNKAIVYYGTDPDNLSLNEIETVAKTLHHVNLTSLSANTKYYYKVEIEGEIFGKGEFRTAPAPGTYSSFTWAMISDTQRTLGPGHNLKTAEALRGKNYTFVANVGDIVDDGFDQIEYDYYFGVSSIYFNTIPFVPVIGNHDIRKPSLFQNYFINSADPSKKQFFYSFNWSSVHFQVLDFPHGRQSELTESQENWMKQDLANAQSLPFRIVMFHCPIVGSAFFGRNEFLINNVLPILQEYNVTAVFHGHEHHFERGHFGNLMYMILGGGGATQDPGLLPQPETDILTVTPCYTVVKTEATSLTFLTYTTWGVLFDNYTINSEGF